MKLLKALKKTSEKGFTLVELLVVIAVIGVLAAVVLVAINPAEQLARARDAGRKSTATSLFKSAQAYYTVNARFPIVAAAGAPADWITTLVTAGELKSVPAEASTSFTSCIVTPSTTIAKQSEYCYANNDADAPSEINVIVRLESASETSKCTTPGDTAFFVLSSADGKGGVVCSPDTGSPTDTTAGTYTYL